MKKIIKPTICLLFLGLFTCVLFFSYKVINIKQVGSVLAASSPWTQTDWSGGATSGTVETTVSTFSSKTNSNVTTPGQISLDSTGGWVSDYVAWSYRKKITFDNTFAKIGVNPEALLNYPLLIKINSGNINYNDVQNLGEDLRFTDSDGTIIPYEIEKWNEGGDSFVWVKIPEIAIGNTDHIYLYYGSLSATDGQQPNSVWANDYAGVWHMNETSGTLINDSTVNGNDAVKYADGLPPATDGMIAGTQNFNGGNNFLTVSNSASLNPNNITMSGWFTVNTLAAWNSILMKSTDSNWNNGYGIYYSSGLCGFINNYNSYKVCTSIPQSDTYKHIAVTYNGSVLKMYINGSEVSTFNTTVGLTSNSGPLLLGRGAGGPYQWNGKLDELRISNQAKSVAWVAVEYQSGINTFNSFGSRENKYQPSSTLESNILDSGVAMDWGLLNYTNSGTGNVNVKVRTDSASNMSGATAWASCNVVINATDISANNCVDDGHRYIQYQILLQSSGATTPIFEEISIAFVPSDQVPPDVNATDFSITGLEESGDWHKDEATITWTEGSDDDNGNGILGYCISLDEADQDSSHGLNPQNTAGILAGKDDGVSQNYCPYIVVGDTFSISTVTGLNLVSGKEYFFSIKAVDLGGNIYTGADQTWKDVISFKYDNTAPTAPFYISLPANFLSSKDVVITWPVGVGGADDVHSGLAGLQYRIGETGIWYGDLHTGMNDLLVNDGSYVTNETFDYPVLNEGNNLIYFRAVDNVGNYTAEEDYIRGVLKLNTVAPSPVRNLTVSPVDSDENVYSFHWNTPSIFTGSGSGITYCYTVNTIPSEGTCTFTPAGMNELDSDAFATQPGENTMYIVAKDEAGNINYATYSEPGSSVIFSYSGTAPGIPQNLDVADISVKATENWRLVLSWDRPTSVGAGISYYNIYRSASNTSCSIGSEGFSKIGSSTSTSYIDPDLEQKNYYYCIKACDSANNCSASSGTVGRLPTGKYTTPADLLSSPEVSSFTTRKAVISWVTDRASDSSIEYGLESGKYFEAEVANSNQLAAHTIPLNNLEPGTTYFYRAKWTDVDGNTGVSDEKTFATLPPPLVSNVTVSNITTNSAIITFKVVNAVEASILYGLTEGYGGQKVVSTSLVESTYSTQVTNLSEGSLYNFKFHLRDMDNNTYTYFENHQFSTLPFPRIEDIQIEEVKNSSQPTVNILWKSNVPITSFVRIYPMQEPNQKRDQIDLEVKSDHAITLTGLLANTKYGMLVSGRDSLGNEAISNEYQFTTDEDSRPPVVSNIKVETRMSSNATVQNEAQLIISWDTDEAATSQVEYGEGSTGEYTQKTLVDDGLTFNHLIIINNLRPSSVYHLRVMSEDSVGNTGLGRNLVTISAQMSENPLDIIISRLSEAFGFIR